MALVGQVHVDAVGSSVIRHRQFVIAVVTHLLHDLQKSETLVNKHLWEKDGPKSDTDSEARLQYQKQHHIVLPAKPPSVPEGA